MKKKCKDFIENIGLGNALKVFEGSYSHQFRSLLNLLLNSKRIDLINFLQYALKYYDYNNKSELLLAIHIFDIYRLKEIFFEELNEAIIGLTITKGIKLKSNTKLHLSTDFGDTKIINPSKILKTKEVDPKIRRNQCHFMTCAYLYNFPKLYGAYYYIPNYFRGNIEHSVLFDYERGFAYDMANNAAIPLDFFLKFYPNYAFLISGKEFIDLNEQTVAEFHESLDMAIIEQIRRVRKKQG